SVTDGHAHLRVTETSPDKASVLIVTKAPSLQQIDFGNPLASGGTAYDVCIYNGLNTLVRDFRIDRAGETTCDGNPCWKSIGQSPPLGKGYKFNDPTLSSDGVRKMLLKGGSFGSAKFVLKATNKSATLELGTAAALNGATDAQVLFT